MKINKDTKLIFSIAERPGNFGTTFFNRAFACLELDYIYKALRLSPDGDLDAVIRAIRALGIAGCSVTMPFKERVLPLLDRLDPQAKKIGAVNTIVNTDGVLTGYNTDFSGVLNVVRENLDVRGKTALVCGLGGVAKAVVPALQELGATVFVTGRDEKKLKSFLQTVSAEGFPWHDLEKAKGFLFVNATSVGMAPAEETSIVSTSTLKNFEAVLDVVGQPSETKLIQTAKSLGLKTVTGGQMVVEQAVCQFQLYTGQKFPREILNKIL
ncbi:MAG: shikimate dehydrogenase [Deltaproteobacteria bacterium]|nr:shikimate dehydrogenase [Deltaproteobacteria bacterium]